MDINQIYNSVIQVLFLYVLPKIAEGGLQEVGAKLTEAPFKLFNILKERFEKNNISNKAFNRFLKDPNNSNNEEEFRQQLLKILDNDKAFKTKIEKFIISSNLENISINQNVSQYVAPYININAKETAVVNLMLSIQGTGANTLGNAFSNLLPLTSPLPALTAKGEDIFPEMNKIIEESSKEMAVDFSLIMNILQPVITEDYVNSKPSPVDVLNKIISEIGISLDNSGFFQSGFSKKHRQLAYRELPMNTLCKEFGKDDGKIFLLMMENEFKMPPPEKSSNLIEKLKLLFHKKEISNKKQDNRCSYILYYDQKPIIGSGDYHIELDSITERIDYEVSLTLNEGNSKQKKTPMKSRKDFFEKIPLTADVLAKMIRALLHDYIFYMRYREAPSLVIQSLKNNYEIKTRK